MVGKNKYIHRLHKFMCYEVIIYSLTVLWLSFCGMNRKQKAGVTFALLCLKIKHFMLAQI